MNIAISSIRTKNHRIDRYELVTAIQKLGYNVKYIGRQSEAKLHSDYHKYNVEFLSIPMSRDNLNPFKELKTVLSVLKILKKNKIDHIIVYGIRTFPTIVLAARLAGVKKILCIVNGSGRLFQIKGFRGMFAKSVSYPMLWLSFLLSSFILFQNPDDQNMIKRKGLLWRKNFSVVNGSGVNLADFKQEELENNPVFLMVSRITGSKGVNEFVNAAIKVKALYPEAMFQLIGPMDNQDSSLDMSNLSKAVDEKIISLIGKVEDVRPYIKRSRIFVLPSYYPEGIPRSILEAMAMGRPVITTDVPGCRETVINGKNGFKIPPKDSKALSEKMIWMVENMDHIEKMGQYSRTISEEKFDINKVNKKILESLSI